MALPYRKFDAQSGVGNIALAFGRPMIVTKVGGLPALVDDSRAIVEPDNPRSISTAINRILLDQELYEKLARDSRDLGARYSWTAAIDKTLKVYRNILPERIDRDDQNPLSG